MAGLLGILTVVMLAGALGALDREVAWPFNSGEGRGYDASLCAGWRHIMWSESNWHA